MNLQSGLRRIYVVLAALPALYGVIWLPVYLLTRGKLEDGEVVYSLISFGGCLLASPLVYFALVGLTKLVEWIVSGFRAVPRH